MKKKMTLTKKAKKTLTLKKKAPTKMNPRGRYA